MCTSNPDNTSGQALRLVQSGLVLWEAPRPGAEWSLKTLSLCADGEATLLALVKRVFRRANGPWFRIHVCHPADALSALQRRHLRATLAADVPGFKDTVVGDQEGMLVSVSKLAAGPDGLNLGYLDSYRDTVLVGGGATISEPLDFWNVLSTRPLIFDLPMFASLAKALPGFILWRFLNMETHAVAQAIGSAQSIEPVSKALEDLHVAAVHDVREIAPRITAWR